VSKQSLVELRIFVLKAITILFYRNSIWLIKVEISLDLAMVTLTS